MIIVDTSVAIKWLRSDEDGHENALLFLKNHLEGREKIVVPGLFFIEAANALATNTILSHDDVSEGMRFLFDVRLQEYSPTQKDIIDASISAKTQGTSVYDMLYVIIARNKKTTVITSDKKFARKADSPFVKVI